MEKQIIISISREYGSGGHYIAEKLAKELGVVLLDHNLLDKISEEKGINLSDYKNLDESPKKAFVSRTVRGMSNSAEENLAQIQFDYIREKAHAGTSMIIVGRCADYILKDRKELIRIFVLADQKDKIMRIMKVRNMSEAEAKKAIARHEQKRKRYHNSHADTKWGDSRHYDICINSSKLGLDETVDYLKEFITKRAERIQ